MDGIGPISVILLCLLVAFTFMADQAILALQAWWCKRKREREALPRWNGR